VNTFGSSIKRNSFLLERLLFAAVFYILAVENTASIWRASRVTGKVLVL